MWKFLIPFLLGAAFCAFLVDLHDAKGQSACKTALDAKSDLKRDHGEMLVGSGLRADYRASLLLFVNDETRSWTLVQVFEDGCARSLVYGHSWFYLREQRT